ncbi:unnamed protein product, partial [Cylicocyclus nassatus]
PRSRILMLVRSRSVLMPRFGTIGIVMVIFRTLLSSIMKTLMMATPTISIGTPF